MDKTSRSASESEVLSFMWLRTAGMLGLGKQSTEGHELPIRLWRQFICGSQPRTWRSFAKLG